jgi:transposase
MWTDQNRARYDRRCLRSPSDLTDEEWTLVEPGTVDVRAVVDGLRYVLSTGCQWRAIPRDRPPRSTINHYFCRWREDGALSRHRCARLRWRQEDQGQEAACAGRYPKLVDGVDDPCGGCAGPRWGCAADGRTVAAVSAAAQALCRWRLSGAEIPTRAEARLSPGEGGDRAAL